MFGIGESNSNHPALKGFSSTWEAVKHVGKKTLKGAAKWGMILGIGGLVLAGLSMFTPIGILATASSYLFGTTGIFTSLGLAGLTAGAVGGAVIGALKGVGSADEAVQEAEERRILNYDRGSARAQRDMLFNIQAAQQMAAAQGVSPGALPMGRGQNGPGIG